MIKRIGSYIADYLRATGGPCSLVVVEYGGDAKVSLVLDCGETMISLEVLADNTCDVMVVETDSEELRFSNTTKYSGEKELLSGLTEMLDTII